MVLVPRRRLVQSDRSVVAGRCLNEAGDGLLEGVVEGVLGDPRDPSLVRGEGGLGVVQEAGPDGVGRERARILENVEAGRVLATGALLEQHLGEGVGHERGQVQGGWVLWVLARVETDPGRQVELPRTDMDGLAVLGGDGLRQNVLLELGEELAGLGDGMTGQGSVGHDGQDRGRIARGGPVSIREVH